MAKDHDLIILDEDIQELNRELRRTRQSITIAQDRLRRTINGGAVVKSIGYCIGTLIAGEETRSLLGAPTTLPLGADRITSLRVAMDGSLRLLDKLLPSLKSIDVEGAINAAAPSGTVYKVVTQVPRDPKDPAGGVIEREYNFNG